MPNNTPADSRRGLVCRHLVFAALVLGMLVGCKREEERSLSHASISRSLPTGGTARSVRAAPAAASADTEEARFARLAALPLLATLSDGEKLALFSRLAAASPSERLTLVSGYQWVERLPDRQKEVLLSQLEDIVPVTTPASRLVCNCSDGIRRELCVKESCSNRTQRDSLCNRACGTLAAYGNECSAAPRCATR